MCVFLCAWDWKWKERCEFVSLIVKCKKGFFAIILSLTFSLSSLFSHTHTHTFVFEMANCAHVEWMTSTHAHTNTNAYTKEIDKYCSKYYFLSFVWRSGIFRQHLSHGENDEKGCIIINSTIMICVTLFRLFVCYSNFRNMMTIIWWTIEMPLLHAK